MLVTRRTIDEEYTIVLASSQHGQRDTDPPEKRSELECSARYLRPPKYLRRNTDVRTQLLYTCNHHPLCVRDPLFAYGKMQKRVLAFLRQWALEVMKNIEESANYETVQCEAA